MSGRDKRKDRFLPLVEMTGNEMLEIVCPRVLTRRKLCNVGRKQKQRQKMDFSFWFTRIIYDVDSGYLQSTNSDQLRAHLQLLLEMTGKEMLELVFPRVLTRRKLCNVGRKQKQRQKMDFSFWFTRIIYDVDSGYLQSTNSDQLRAHLQLLFEMTGKEMLELVFPQVLTRRKFCNVGENSRKTKSSLTLLFLRRELTAKDEIAALLCRFVYSLSFPWHSSLLAFCGGRPIYFVFCSCRENH